MISPFQSLRWKLQAWHGLLLLLVVIASTFPAFHLASEIQLQRIDRELMVQERTLVRAMMDAAQGIEPELPGTPPKVDRPFIVPSEFIQRLRSQSVKLPVSVSGQFHGKEAGYAYFSVRDRDDKIILQSENAPSDLKLLPIPSTEMVEKNQSQGTRREFLRSSIHGLKIGIGRDITPENQEMRGLMWIHILVGLSVWLFGLMGGWWLSGRAIRPIQTIGETASRIAEGNLQERIDVTEMDSELSQLSHVLNETFERLHAAFERQRQFTADASHELRTPITILLSETQRILKRERTSEEYREAIETCGATAQRMRRLVEALLLLARQDNHETHFNHEPCDLATIAQDAVDHLAGLADERDLRLEAHLSPAVCFGDSGALTILVTNLITNALDHGGNIKVTTLIQHNQAVLTVSDDGPGIAASDLPHIFERFYRADQARTGSSGHTGLGLAIVKAIVDNNQGSIHVTSDPATGASFEVRFPTVG